MRTSLKFLMLVGIAAIAVVTTVAPAVQSGSPHGRQIETAPTWCDQTGYSEYAAFDRIIDSRDGGVQAVGPLHEGPYRGTPEEAAWEFLKRHADWVGIEVTPSQLKVVRSIESPGGYHVTFDRHVDGVSVYPGNLVITFDKEMNARFFACGISRFKDRVSTGAALTMDEAKRLAIAHIAPGSDPVHEVDMELVIWAGDNRDFAPCWRYLGNHTDPYGDWEVLVDAQTGRIRRVRDRAMSVNGTGEVFDPDPTTTAGMPYGSDFLEDDNDANNVWLGIWRTPVTLYDITDLEILGTHFYYLIGPYASSQDYELPNLTPVMQVNNTSFDFTRDNEYFEEVMCYYHIDKSQRWIQSLGYTNVVNSQLEYDAHAENYDCNAHYHPTGPSGPYLSFGDGNPSVDAAEDGEIIWHEYGHAINDGIMPWWGGSTDEDAMGEGWSDYWAGSYGRSIAAYHAEYCVSWGLRPCFGGRLLQQGLHYPEDAGNPDPHYSGMIWSQALYEAEVLCGQRSVMNTIGLQHQFLLSDNTTMPVAALALIAADQMLYSGRYSVYIADGCVPRGLLSRPANDTCPGYAVTSLPYTHQTSTATANNDYSNCVGTDSPDIVYTVRVQCPQLVTVNLCATNPNGSYDTGLEVRWGGSCPGTTPTVCNDDACGVNNRQSEVQFVASADVDYYVIVHGYSTFSGPVTVSMTGQLWQLPIGNDACPGTAINSLPFTALATTCSANNDHYNCAGSESPDVFYTMNLPACYSVTVSLCSANYDTGIEVRMGGACPGSALVACNDDYCGLQSRAQFAATANENYYIIVHGYGAAQGYFTLEATGIPYVAGNDSCPGTYILSLPYSDFGNTLCADNDWEKCGSSLARDVVYRFQSMSCQTLSASLCGSSFDTQIEVRRGGSCPGAVPVGCNDDYCGLQSFMEFPATEGETYYFLVHGYANGAGAYLFQLSATAGGLQANDVCEGATPILSVPYQDQGSTNCATNSRVNCVTANSPEVFYRLNVESCTDVVARLCYSNYDTGLEVRTGGACPGSTLVDCNDDNLGCNPEGSLQSIVQFRALASTDYYLIVHGYGANVGIYVLDIIGSTCAPESLVVQRQGNNASLNWAPVTSTGAVTYRVYRSTSPDVIPLPGNLIGTTGTAAYTDLNALSSSEKYFYAVTADGPALAVSAPPEIVPALSELEEKVVSPEALREMRSRVIPAYIDPADIGGPNPNKSGL